MNFTFGIITSGNSEDNINLIIDTIESQHIQLYEIIIVGQAHLNRNLTKIIPFDENIKKAWITKKKNLITKHAKYENIVYLHDYIKFDGDWYKGYIKYGDNFKICMNIIKNADGTRFRDWILDPWTDKNIRNIVSSKSHKDKSLSLGCLLPYKELTLSKYMYISGSYWVAKRDVMLEFPLDENLQWGQGEDLAWSSKVRKKYEFSFNPYSTVKSIKLKNVVFYDAEKSVIAILKLCQKGFPIYPFSVIGRIKKRIKKIIKKLYFISRN